MKSEVWHMKREVYEEWLLRKRQELHFPADYELVARVEIDSPEDAFALTNHIERSWDENPGVELVKKSRSTSVGDVVVMPDKTVHLVAICGFTEHGVAEQHTFNIKPF